MIAFILYNYNFLVTLFYGFNKLRKMISTSKW